MELAPTLAMRSAGRNSSPIAPQDAAAAAAAPGLRVLLIDDGAHRADLIRDSLARQGHLVVGIVEAGLLIHDCVARLMPDVVIVDSESPSRDTLEHLAAVNAAMPRPVVVFAEDGANETMRAALRAGVSAYVIAGLSPERLLPVLQVAIARFEQDRALRDQLERAETRLAERQLVERAKGFLMREIGLSEEQAHAHLRRLAMDRGERMGETARRIVVAAGVLDP
jgi:two-component system, response regulator / RNA-binding antiterminator